MDEQMVIHCVDDAQAHIDVVAAVDVAEGLFLMALARAVDDFPEEIIDLGFSLDAEIFLDILQPVAERLELLAVSPVGVEEAEAPVLQRIEECTRPVRLADDHTRDVIVMAPLALLDAAPLFPDMCERPRQRARRAVEVALLASAANRSEEVGVFLCLHALGERLDAEVLGHADDRADDAARFLREAAQKAHVELDEVDRVILEDVQRGVAAAEVVEPDLIALLAQAVDGLLDGPRVPREDALRDLDVQEIARHGVLPARSLDEVEDVQHVEVVAREVERDRRDGQVLVEPLAQHAADLLEHESVEAVDEAHLLEDRDEGPRREEADLWVYPASQGLHAAELARYRADDRLVIDLDPMLLDGLIEVRDDAIADIAVDHSARARDIDFLYCAIVDRPVRLRLDTAPGDIRIADAVRARKEMAAGMVEALRRFRQRMQDVLLDARTVVHRDEMECHARRMAVEVLKIAAVKQPYRLLIGIEQAIRFLAFRNIETAGQVLHDTRELP